MAAVNFTGRWQEGDNVNKEEFCLAMGISPEMSKQLGAMRAVLEIVHDGDRFDTKETAPDGTVIVDEKTTVGVPHTPKTIPGIKEMEYLNTWEEDGKALRSTCLDKEVKLVSHYRLGENGELVVDMTTQGDVTAVLHYTKE